MGVAQRPRHEQPRLITGIAPDLEEKGRAVSREDLVDGRAGVEASNPAIERAAESTPRACFNFRAATAATMIATISQKAASARTSAPALLKLLASPGPIGEP